MNITWLKEEKEVKDDTRFDKLIKFLNEDRKRVEKHVDRCDAMAKLKDNKNLNKQQSGQVQGGDGQRREKDNCLVHPKVSSFSC